MQVVIAVGFGIIGSQGSIGVGIGFPLIVHAAIWGILNKIKSKDVALLLPEESNIFNSSLSKADVFVIRNVWVIAVVHPVEIVVPVILSINGSKSKSKINLV